MTSGGRSSRLRSREIPATMTGRTGGGRSRECRSREIRPRWARLLLWTSLVGGLVSARPPERPPNIALFLLDDVGHGDFGYTGHPIARTPSIDGFSQSATRLTTLYAGAPICSPSRAALLSGRFADATGVWDLVTPGASEMQLLPDALILGNVLAQGGYACGQVGKWHVSHKSSQVGLSAYGFESISPTQKRAIEHSRTVIEWVSAQVNASRPFFLYWDPHECHEPVSKKSPEVYRGIYGTRAGAPPGGYAPSCSMQAASTGASPYCAPRPPLAERNVGTCGAPGCGSCAPCERGPQSAEEASSLQAAMQASWSNQRTYLGEPRGAAMPMHVPQRLDRPASVRAACPCLRPFSPQPPRARAPCLCRVHLAGGRRLWQPATLLAHERRRVQHARAAHVGQRARDSPQQADGAARLLWERGALPRMEGLGL